LKTTTHHADSGEDESAETDDSTRINRKSFEGCHQRLCPGEVHRSLSVRHTREGKSYESGCDRADGVGKGLFERTFRPPIGRPNEQPKGSLIQSGKTAESIHFAPPLTSLRQHGAKLSAGF